MVGAEKKRKTFFFAALSARSPLSLELFNSLLLSLSLALALSHALVSTSLSLFAS